MSYCYKKGNTITNVYQKIFKKSHRKPNEIEGR